VGATGINHVSISANDLDESTKFYEEVFGMERIPAPDFGPPVRWLEGRVDALPDPGGNLIELNWPDMETLDRSKYPELTRLADHVPQSAPALSARLYLGPADATASPGTGRRHRRLSETSP